MSNNQWGSEWDHVFDVVVVGSGAAGMSAAATAATLGASVAVLERGVFPGGTTAKSGGVMWVPDNPVMRANGVADPRESALRYLARTAYPAVYNPQSDTLGLSPNAYELITAFYDRGAEALQFLVDAEAFALEPVPYPDYFAHLPENETPVGRTVQPTLPPTWTRGVDPSGGHYLVAGMQAAAEAHGARVLTEHRVAHVVRTDDGTVIGVEARAGTRTVLIGARRGVIFASGGFLHDQAKAQTYLRGPIFGGAASETATGDFVDIGIQVGAQLGNMAHAWWSQVVVELAVRVPATIRDAYSPFGDSMMIVNKYGQRVVNEKAPYNERSQVHFHWDASRGEYPNLVLFMVFDEAVRRSEQVSRFRFPVPLHDEEELAFYVARGDTFEALADDLRSRLTSLAGRTGGTSLPDDFATRLASSVAQFDSFAVAGRDLAFGRGESPIEQTWAQTPRGGAATGAMHPFAAEGPYYAVILGAGGLDTKGGPVTDAAARVLDTAGDPIPGLFGAGNCVASPAGQAYWGPGGTIGPAVVFGYIAARSVLAD